MYTIALSAIPVHAVYSAACMTRVQLSDCKAVEAALLQFLKVTAMCTGSAAAGCDWKFLYSTQETGTVTGSNQLVRTTNPEGETQVAEACAMGTNVHIRSTNTKTPKTDGDPLIVDTSVFSGKKK